MKILQPDHKITGNEFIRTIVPLNCLTQHCSDNFALSVSNFTWVDIREHFGVYWKNKTIKQANKYKDLEFCLVDIGDYFPNRKPSDFETIELLGWLKPVKPCNIPTDPDQKLNITCAVCGMEIDFRKKEVYISGPSYVCKTHAKTTI